LRWNLFFFGKITFVLLLRNILCFLVQISLAMSWNRKEKAKEKSFDYSTIILFVMYEILQIPNNCR
jgi:hypothetical protein